MSRQALAAALVCILSLLCDVSPSSAQSQVPSQRVSPVTPSERIDGLLAVQKSRSSKFEALRDERTNTLRLIEDKSQRLRLLDKTIAQLRDELTQRASSSKLSSVDNLDYESEAARIVLEVERFKREKDLVVKRLDARRSFLSGLTPKVDVENDKDVAELGQRLLLLERDISSIGLKLQELKRQSDAVQTERERQQKEVTQERSAREDALSRAVNEQERLQTEVRNLGYDLDAINNRALRLIEESDADGNFRTWNSAIFSALVGFVIAGFFYIASSDDRVRYTIFANDSGIQFITLFSIVIAVILFGIIGVLEGKELSALLGGLSGYILGRHAATPAVQAPRGDGDPGPGAKPITPADGTGPAAAVPVASRPAP